MCTPDEKQCGAAQTAAVCSKDGQWLSDSAPCEFVCTGKGECTGTCKPGDKKCGDAPDTLTPFECDDQGNWVKRTACTNLCADGSCGGSCMPGKTRCVGNKPETCSEMGTWTPGQECKDQTCVDGACTGECAPTGKQCGGNNNPQTCDGQGNWKNGPACQGQTCVSGTCMGACMADAPPRCSPDQKFVQTCGANGAWMNGDSCGDRGCAGAMCNVCKPNLKSCSGNALKQCSGDGRSYLPDVTCKVRCDGAALRCIDCEKKTETCNGVDDDCDGTTDNNVAAKNCANTCLGQQKCVIGGAGRWDPLQCPIGSSNECCGANGTNCGAGRQCKSGACQIICDQGGKVPNANGTACECPANAIECAGTCVTVPTKKFCVHANYPPGGGGVEQNPQDYCWLKDQQSECSDPSNFCRKFNFNRNLGMVIHTLNNVKQKSSVNYRWFCCADCSKPSDIGDAQCQAASLAGQMCTSGNGGF